LLQFSTLQPSSRLHGLFGGYVKIPRPSIGLPNEKLEKADVPDATTPWPEIEMFALTFNGYEAFPGEGCANLAKKLWTIFPKTPRSSKN